MNRLTQRTHLRRQLQEVVEDQFSDSILNDHLNLGLARMQGEIMAIDEMAFLVEDTTNIVANQELYSWPTGFWYEHMLWMYNTATAKYDIAIHPASSQSAPREVRPEGSTLEYSHYGQWFKLSPIPTTALANGLKLISMPTLTMALDTDSPPFPTPLHWAVVLFAKLIALGETGEAADEAQKVLGPILQRLPSYYHRRAAAPQSLRPDADKSYRGYGGGRRPTGTDRR